MSTLLDYAVLLSRTPGSTVTLRKRPIGVYPEPKRHRNLQHRFTSQLLCSVLEANLTA
jgi:hypothetical protein